MAFWKNVSDGFKVALGRVRKGAFADAFLKGLDIPRDNVTNAYEEHTWTYACINVIMRKIASAPFIVASRAKDNEGNQVELPNHPAAKLLANPNPTMSGTELTQGTVLSLYLNGEGLWLHDFMGQKTPQEIFLHMDPKASNPIFMNESLPVGWKVPVKGGAGTDFSNDELVRYRFIDPDDPLRGFAPVDVANLAINQDFKAGKYNLGLLTNQAVPSGIIQIEDRAWDEATIKRVKKQWDREHKGSERQGRIGWLMGGMTFQSIGLAMRDLDYIEGRRFNREEILATFGVPPAEVGVHDFSNYANAREQGRKFWQNTLIPLLVMYEEVLESQFFQVHFPEVVGFFDLTNVEDLEENLEIKSQVAQRLFAMGVPFTDINERLQMGFNTEGRPWLDQGVRGLAQVSVGTIQEEPAPALPAPAGSVEIFEPVTGGRPRIAKQSQAERRRVFRGNYDLKTVQNIQRTRERVRAYFKAEAARVASALEANYQEIFNRNKADIKSVMEKYDRLKKGIREYEKRKNLFKVLVRAYAKTLTSDIEELVFSFDESQDALRPIAEAEIAAMLADGGMSVAEIAGLTFNTEAPGAIKAVDKRINNIVDFRGSGIHIPQESFNRVRESIIASIQEGDSVGLASQRIRNLYEGFSDQRALVIAQTEMGYAFNTGAFELYGQAGIPQHEWLSAGDADVRDSHLAAEAHGPIPVGETFPNGLQYPNDPAGGPEEVVNCRCTTAPVVATETAIGYYPRKRIARRTKGRRIYLTEARA